VLRLLLRTSRTRATARSEHQKKLLNHRYKGRATDWGCLPVLGILFLGLCLHGMFAFGTARAIETAGRVDAEARGYMVLDQSAYRLDELRDSEKSVHEKTEARQRLAQSFEREATRHVRDYGGDPAAYETRLREHLQNRGPEGFLSENELPFTLFSREAKPLSPLAGLTGLLLIGWWFLMMTFQGEGLELDMQRRRHPMWEWLLSHPVNPAAVFCAEMLAPLAANPGLLLAPVFWYALLHLSGHGFLSAVFGGILIGAPMAVAAACAHKACEITAMLRLAPRNRGAVLGLLSWLGYASFIGAFFLASSTRLTAWVQKALLPVAGLWDWSLFGWLLGLRTEGGSLWSAILLWWVIALVIVFISLALAVRATRRGLAGGFADAGHTAPLRSALGGPAPRFLRDMLYRKELLWFWRDRGAVVQTLLIPCTVAAFQALHFRNALAHVPDHWNWLCGVAVIFGTYFLFILGPRSLVSEGPALWIALTWPRGLENLLKAKARLWGLLATAMVSLLLLLALFLHPSAWWKILLVAAGWAFFSQALAVKSVTLVQAPSSSGEAEPVPKGRQWAATLGTFTFAIGVATGRWELAVTGIVYAWITAAAMWQNFRARLPYLFDAWSELPPPPPTVTHAMVAIIAMFECVAVVTGTFAVAGPSHVWFARGLSYGIIGLLAWIITSTWLHRRDVPNEAIWRWENRDSAPGLRLTPSRAFLVALGVSAPLAFLAHGYSLLCAEFFPNFAVELTRVAEHLRNHPVELGWFTLLAVVIAPVTEEYFFRGLLFRALDKEWGGMKAVLGSALFFAIYHPPTSWLPVGLLGVLNALLFRHSGRLWPCVVAHFFYNACVTLALVWF
jgi:membrane protease YdiL (CAAX protease family)